MPRSSTLLAALAVAALALAPALADARAGGGSSMGSRGMRTYSAPPITNTAPMGAAPMQRSLTAPGYNNPGYGSPAPQGFGARSGFTSGLLGGLLGAGIGGLLFGHGLFGGGGGFGFIGFLLQMVLLYFVVRWLFRRFFRNQPMMAGPGLRGYGAQAAPPNPAGGFSPARPVPISPSDYGAFEQILQQVQDAWSNHDLRRMQNLATPEMISYFGEQLAEQDSRGVRNTVTDVKLEKGDLAEAWSEGNREFATVAMRFSMVDATRDRTGRIVDGDANLRTIATELWTFFRVTGGRWQLSAIQQTR